MDVLDKACGNRTAGLANTRQRSIRRATDEYLQLAGYSTVNSLYLADSKGYTVRLTRGQR